MRTSKMICGLAALALVGGGSVAWGQFTNDDLETGDFTGWTVQNTPNGVGAPGVIEQYDIDGGGPKPSSYAAKFAVGQAQFQSGQQEGVEMVQSLDLVDGVEYTVSYSWATKRESNSGNVTGGVFSVIVDGQIVGTPLDSGGIGGSYGFYKYGEYSATFTASGTGPHEVGARITRPYQSPGDVFSYVDDFDIDPPTGGGGPSLRAIGDCPGRVTVSWANATPSRPMAIVYANNTGSFVVPGGPCAGTPLGLGTSGIHIAYQGGTGGGSGQVSTNIGTGVCGHYIQMVVVSGSPCETSNVVQLP